MMNTLPLFSSLSLQLCWHVPCWKKWKLFGRFVLFCFVLLKSLKSCSVFMMSFFPPWTSWCLFYDLCSPCLPEIHWLLDSLLLFSSNFMSSQNLWSRSKNKPFQSVTAWDNSFFYYHHCNLLFFLLLLFFFLNEESPSIPFGTFLLANSSRVSLSYSTALLDIYVSFPQEYCSSVLGIYYIQFLSVFVLSTFTTVLCQKN